MKTKLTLGVLSIFLMIGCTKETNNLPLEDGYKPFASTMILSKKMVQEVLLAAYNNPDLNGFTSTTASSRNNCPDQIDHNPDVFPKTLIYDYGTDCLTDAGSQMKGELEILVTDKLGVEGMEIHLLPHNSFFIDGNNIRMEEEGEPLFKATYARTEDGLDSYDLEISDIAIINTDNENYRMMEMLGGKITFEDVDKNNDDQSLGPLAYVDDLAVINFDEMTFLNDNNELLKAVVQSEIKFDLFCNCPLAGKVEINSEADKSESQLIDYTVNSNCRGELLVDTEVVECE